MAAMEPIPAHTTPSAASAARGSAEQGEKAGSPDTMHTGEHRFEDVLKSTAAGPENPSKGRPSAHGGHRTAIAGKEAKADTSTPPSVVSAAGGSIAPIAPNDSVPAAGGAASEPMDAGSAEADPVLALAGAATLPTGGNPLSKRLSSEIDLAGAGGKENGAHAQAPKAGGPGADPSPPTAPASEPKGAGPAKADPVPVLAGAATLPEEGDPLLKPISSGIRSAAAGGEENAAPAQAPKASGPGTVSALPPTAASEPKNAGTARVDGTPVGYGNMNPAPEGARDAEGTRKKKDDASARNEGQAEPPAMQAADGNRGVAERPAAPRPVAPASDPGVVRFEENAFIITRKSDTSVEVTLAPPGVGKLEIEVVLEKGVVNARITAADSAGREAIARSLPQIVDALARDGMNVGGFTVSLKERRDRPEDAPGRGPSRHPDARLLSAVPAASASAASAGLVDIFV